MTRDEVARMLYVEGGPALVILLRLEAAPEILSLFGNESELERLADWLRSQPDAARLVEVAQEAVRV